MIKIKGINHVAIRIGSTDRAREFYGKLLGLAPAQMPAMSREQGQQVLDAIDRNRSLPRPKGGQWFQAGNSQLHLISAEKHEGAINPFGAHIAFDVEDLDEVKRTLREGGIDHLDASGGQVWILDPGGNTVELRRAG